jgi:hypothetical protein
LIELLKMQTEEHMLHKPALYTTEEHEATSSTALVMAALDNHPGMVANKWRIIFTI